MNRHLCTGLLLGLAVIVLTGCAGIGSGANNLDDCVHPHSMCYNYGSG